MRVYLSILVLTSLSGCFGRSDQDAVDGSESSSGGGPGGTGGISGGENAGGQASGGGSAGGESAFACGCFEGSDAGLLLSVDGGPEIVFSDPPRFHQPDAVDGITWLFECDDPETPIYFDSKCEFLDIIEACHPDEGCLQVQEDAGFKWLSPEGEVVFEGESTFEREYLVLGGATSLDEVSGTLNDEEANWTATFSGPVCHIFRDDCMR